MDTRNFDKEIKQALEAAEMVPSSQVWERIQVANATADKRPLLFWLAAAIISTMLIVAAALAFQQYKSSADNGSQDAESSLALDEAEGEIAKEYGAFPMKSDDRDTKETAQTDQNIAGSKDDVASEIFSRETVRSASNASAVDGSSERISNSSELNSLSIDTDLFKDKNTQTIRKLISEPLIEPSASSIAQPIAAPKEPAEKLIGVSLSLQKNVLSSTKQSSQLKLSIKSLESPKFGFLSSQNTETTLRIAMTTPRDAEFKLLKDCYHFNPKPSKFFLDMYFGGNAAWYTLSSDDLNLEELLENRKASEQIRSSYSLGLRIGGKIYNDFFLRSGFEYTRIDEDFNHAEKTLVSRTFSGVIEIDSIFDAETGEFQYVVEDSMFTETFSTNHLIAKNHYEILSIPIEVGHEWENKRFTYGIFGGIALNIAFDRQGTVLGTDDLTVNFNPASAESEPMFKDRVGLRLNAGVYGAYEVFQDVHIFAEPRFATMVKPITLESQAVQKKFQFVGANFGLRFDL